LILAESASRQDGGTLDMPRRQRTVPLAARVTDADRVAHRDFIVTLGEKAIWKEFVGTEGLEPCAAD
jgi:DNA polymerase III subunit epsilon